MLKNLCSNCLIDMVRQGYVVRKASVTLDGQCDRCGDDAELKRFILVKKGG